jgi:acyl-CoA thioesterase FadM
MRWIRLLSTLLSARFRSRLRIGEASSILFKVWITDIDVSIMNHAAIMTVMETGRLDFMVRTGFFKRAQKSKWYFPSSSIHVQFFRPLKLFQRATLVTRAFHIDERWIYLEQKIIRKEKDIAFCIVKGTVKKGREQLNVLEVLKQLNIGDAPVISTDSITLISGSEKMMNERVASWNSERSDG